MINNSTFLCKGTYGKVYKASIGEKEVAVKKFCLKKNASTFENETFFAFKTRNLKHCVQGVKSYVQDSTGYLIMDLCETDLYKICNTKDCFVEAEAALIFYRVCKAVEELHDSNIAHLDLKLENLLVSSTGEIKICDFGSAVNTEKDGRALLHKKTGTPIYVAPELKRERNILAKNADIWSLGVIFHLLLTRSYPTRDFEVYLTPDSFTLESTYGLSTNAQNLAEQLLSFDVSKRPNIKQILKHKFFKDHSAILKKNIQ